MRTSLNAGFAATMANACRRLGLLLVLCAPATLGAQHYDDSLVTPHGICHVWATIPDGTSWLTDASYNRCALDRAPAAVASMPMPGTPPDLKVAHGSYMVVVNPDGGVDSSLTRAGSTGLDSAFYRQMLETIRRWRFVPGMRAGKPVRTGMMLEVRAPIVDDTLAAHLEWSYHTGTLTDTLMGEWIREPDPVPYAEERTDSIYAAVIRRLVAMQVVTRDAKRPHCLVVSGSDRGRQARLSAIARRLVYGSASEGVFAPLGCESDTTSIRLTLPRVHRTENDRVVLYPSGDRLLEWPRDLAGRSWNGWDGRCVGIARGRGALSMDCTVHSNWDEALAARVVSRSSVPRSDPPKPGTLRLRLRITSRGAYWIDTLQTVLRGPLPRLAISAITDSGPPCNAWEVFSTQRASGLLALHGDPSGDELRVTPVAHRQTPIAPPAPRPRRSLTAPVRFTAFLLGDLGTPATAPIIVQYPTCARTYVLDPARHTLMSQAHARFRVRDLRPQTRVSSPFGTQVFFRIDLDGAPDDVVPLVVVDDGRGWHNAWFARAISPGTYEYAVLYGQGYPPETSMSVYLFRP